MIINMNVTKMIRNITKLNPQSLWFVKRHPKNPETMNLITALLPIIAGYQISPPENKTSIFQLWPYTV